MPLCFAVSYFLKNVDLNRKKLQAKDFGNHVNKFFFKNSSRFVFVIFNAIIMVITIRRLNNLVNVVHICN